ncbi:MULTISPECIES: hypothetical protein [unclassified Acinetobacter]|uniref:hypothetical protein n=1 Tax=unclassified Acinetobacter TaxID=196816 RepID=UPI00244CE806|nr:MULTISPECIES: hypothetical protein [unclassified Acinetobacter]MDH0032575.1 hypothetical protein [Acinetobacter sp. GD04021]MDH0885266.1 hypothetical protein [Acinetobacter sp. GD03873]MDH1084406.1 hypothetical protein [Acinetobacter sp. GD03983]MDH2188294.1 hypothetical protein [Acinetobacter sp. GD03645]MDH2203805.1 hypothetical protein [Acinetobacter sp. GD03647]
MSDKGRKTKRITFNLHERGRQFLGKDRSNVDMSEMIKQINSPQVQEMVKTGTLYGYNGHEIRKRYGMNPPDSVIVDGKVVYLERAFRTLEVYADKEGNVSHVTEFLDNPSGEYARKQYQARVGGFSSAQNYKRAGLGLIPVGFYGFDYVTQPNYTTNVGDGQLFDGLAIPVEQDGLVACFDSATDLTQLSASEAMIAHLLEQQIVRDYDNIHTQTELLNMHGQALDQIDVLSTQVARKEKREALQAQRQHDLYSGMVGEVRSFDSVCEEADALLTESDLARMRINGETPKDKKPKPRIFKSIFSF